MPYSDQEQRRKLEALGLDPERYEVIPRDEFFSSKQPETPAPPAEQSSFGGAFLRGAKRAAIPTLAGIAGTAGTAALLGPGTQPLAAVLLPLAAGIASSTAAGYGQEKLFPRSPEEQSQLEADLKEHKVGAVAGELVPSLATFKPSLSNLKTAFTKLPKAGVSAADDAARFAIAAQRLNVGLGAGLGAVQETALPLIRGEDIDPVRLAMSTIGGGLINEPNRIGRRLGFHPSGELRPTLTPDDGIRGGVGYDRPIGPDDLMSARLGRELSPEDSSLTRTYRSYYQQEAPRTEVVPERAPNKDVIFVDEAGRAQRGTPRGMHNVEVPADERALPAPQNTIERMAQDIAVLEQQMRHLPLAERAQRMPVLEQAKQALTAEQQRLAQAQAPQKLAEQITTEFPPNPNRPPQVGIGGEDIPIGDIKVKTSDGVPVRTEPLPPHPDWRATVQAEQVLPGGKKIPGYVQIDYPDNSRSTNPETLRAEGYDMPDLSRLPQGRYTMAEAMQLNRSMPAQQQELRFQHESTLAAQPLEQLLSDPANAQVFEALKQLAAEKRIALSIDPTLEPTVLGMADLRARVAKLNPKAIAEDTTAHEIAHILLSDMLRHPDPAIRGEAQKGLLILGGDEEKLVQAIGTKITDLYKLGIEGRTKQRFVAWLKDIISRMKAVFSDKEHFTRLLARRMMRRDALHEPNAVPLNDPVVKYQRLVQTNRETRADVEDMLKKADAVKDTNLPGVRSVVESIASRTDPKLAQALANADREGTRYAADFQSKFESGLRLLSEDEQTNALEYLYSALDNEGNAKVMPMNDKVQDFVENVVRPTLAHVADTSEAQGKLIVTDGRGRKIKRMEYYFPQVPRQDVLDKVNNHTNSPEAKKLLDDMYEHVAAKLSIPKEEAVAMWNNEHGKSAILGEGESDFGPLSRAAGIGLPESWRENSLQRALLRYARRSGKALGYFVGLQKDPYAAYLAGIADQFGKDYKAPEGYQGPRYGGDREVRNALKWFKGDYESIDQYIGVASRAVKVGMLQTLTGAADLATFWVHLLPGMQPKDIPIIFKAFKDVSGGVEKAIKMGVASSKSMLLAEPTEAGQSFSGVAGWIQKVHGAADAINKITGRDMLERWARGLTYNAGELLAWSKIGDAFSPASSHGDRKAAVLFLREHAPTGWEQSIPGFMERGEQVPDAMIAHIAASVVDSAQGTYSIRGLPSIALRGQLSPFLSLAKWNIEKWNTFNRQVIGAARRGNLTPLLMVTVGGWLGGEAVEKLREQMTRKKPQHASWDEIMEAGGEGLPYRLLALASYSGYAGIASEITKQMADAASGSTPQGFRFPAVSFFSNGFNRIAQASQAVGAGENVIDVFARQLPLQLAKDSIQLARIGLAFTPNGSQDVTRANKARDLRVFRQLNDIPVQPFSGTGRNPFQNPMAEEFDRTQSIPKAAQLAPQLRAQAIERSGGDREKLRSQFNSLRAQPSDLMPSMRSNPKRFQQYLAWLAQTQGPEAARQALQAYFQKVQLDRAKGAMIPSL